MPENTAISDSGHNRGVTEQVLQLCAEPKKRERLHAEIGKPDDEIRAAVQDLLYSGRLTTTPDWRYESTDTDRSGGGE